MSISKEELKDIIREELEDFESRLLLKLRFEFLPYASEEEQKDIEDLYGEEMLEEDEEDIAFSREIDA